MSPLQAAACQLFGHSRDPELWSYNLGSSTAHRVLKLLDPEAAQSSFNTKPGGLRSNAEPKALGLWRTTDRTKDRNRKFSTRAFAKCELAPLYPDFCFWRG
ncbi:hypothetical protein LEMLEM_LOCUS20867 [Lemmus lemmus]